VSPQTEAGRRLLDRESLNSRSFTLITAEAIEAIEQEAREEGARLARQEFRPERFDRSWWHYADDCPVPPGTAGAGDSPDPHDDIVQAATGGPDFTPAVWPTAAPDPLGEAPRAADTPKEAGRGQG
jgi:hypothetical protein